MLERERYKFFYIDKRRNAPKSHCKTCQQEFNNKWREKNKEKWRAINKESQKRWRLKNIYKISEIELERLNKRSKGKCEICRIKKAEYIDHCHETGKVRGILCRNCNTGIGMFNDDANFLIRASKYLNKTKSQ